MPPFNHFTTKAKEAIRKAHELAIERGQNHVNPLHLLTALIIQDESVVTSILDKLEVDTMLLTDSLIDEIEGVEGGQTISASYQVYLTPELAQLIENSAKIALDLKDEFVSTEHLFIAALETNGPARDLLTKFKLNKGQVLEVLEEVRTATDEDAPAQKKFKTLTKYTRSLTKLAQANKLDPVIGRDTEIRRAIQVLSRRTKNNPVLIGDPGTGKTAIVEGLAEKIIELLRSQDKREALSMRGLERAQRFDWAAVSDEIMNVYLHARRDKEKVTLASDSRVWNRLFSREANEQ